MGDTVLSQPGELRVKWGIEASAFPLRPDRNRKTDLLAGMIGSPSDSVRGQPVRRGNVESQNPMSQAPHHVLGIR